MNNPTTYYTIQLAPDYDATVWCFDDEAAYLDAVRHAQQLGHKMHTAVADGIPKDGQLADLDEFKAWSTTFAHMKQSGRNVAPLPPNPDGQNDVRAKQAHETTFTFGRVSGMASTGVDEQTILGAMMAALMHWCDRTGTDFDAALRAGRERYREETTPQ